MTWPAGSMTSAPERIRTRRAGTGSGSGAAAKAAVAQLRTMKTFAETARMAHYGQLSRIYHCGLKMPESCSGNPGRLAGVPAAEGQETSREPRRGAGRGEDQRRRRTQKRSPKNCKDRMRVAREPVRGETKCPIEERQGEAPADQPLGRGVQPERRADRAFGGAHQPHDADLLAVQIERETHCGRHREDRREREDGAEEQSGAADQTHRVAKSPRELFLGLRRLDAGPELRGRRD